MPEHASRFVAALYDQDHEDRLADWGGDELFTRMPRRRPVDNAPAPRFRPALALVDTSPGEPSRAESPAPREPEARQPRFARPAGSSLAGSSVSDPADSAPHRSDLLHPADPAPPDPSERGGLTLVGEPPGGAPPATVRRWDGAHAEPPAVRPSTVITGRPDGMPRPLRASETGRSRRPARSPAERIGARPERIVGWAFALGLLLILIAISTADAATF